MVKEVYAAYLPELSVLYIVCTTNGSWHFADEIAETSSAQTEAATIVHCATVGNTK